MKCLKLILLIFAFSVSAKAQSVAYYAQTVTGSGNGTSCANARAISTLTLTAGSVAHLCGTITSPRDLVDGGTAASPAVIDGDGLATTTGGFTQRGNYITIQNLRFQGAGVFMAKGTHHLTMRNNWLRNDCNNNDGDLVGSEGSADFVFEGNYAENCATAEANHDDILQTWGGSARWTIRYNWFVMNTTQEFNKSFHMLEGIAGPIDIYGNVYVNLRGADSANGVNMNSNESSMVARIYGNTVVQKGGGNNLFNLKGNGSWDLENNITYVTGVGNALTGDAVGTSRMTRRNNLWFGPGSPGCVATEICGQNPQFRNYANNDFSLAAGSPALGRGVTLPVPFATAVLQGATWPNPMTATRPAGAWDLGAFINSGGTTPPPTPEPPTITTIGLPAATVGVAYSAQVNATGGMLPYACSGTGAPFVVNANCTVTGTAATEGTVSVSVNVAGADGLSSSRTYGLTVEAVPPPQTSDFYMYTEPSGPLMYAGVAGSSSPICKNVAIRDTSDGGPITVNLSASQPWISMTPNTGGTRYQSNWCVNPSGLVAGTHNANVTLVAAGPNQAGETVNNSPFSVPVTVTLSSAAVVSINVTPTSATIQSGGTQQFTATVTGSTNTAVTWSATGGTVSASGLFTAGPAGGATVTARSVADATKAASAVVTVTAVPPPPSQVTCSMTTQNNGSQITSIRIDCR